MLIALSQNPVTNTIIIRSSVIMSNASITISSMQGKTVYQSTQSLIEGGSVVINASGLAKGMYVISVQSASGNSN